MSSQTDWYQALVEAADELGYIVESIDYVSPGRVALVPMKGPDRVRIVFEGIFTSGALLRERLKPVPE
jgi:hypothetical protein